MLGLTILFIWNIENNHNYNMVAKNHYYGDIFLVVKRF